MWDYIYAGSIIAAGLLFAAWMLTLGKKRMGQRKTKHQCARNITVRDARGNELAKACEFCEDEVLARYPMRVLAGDARPMEER